MKSSSGDRSADKNSFPEGLTPKEELQLTESGIESSNDSSEIEERTTAMSEEFQKSC